MNDLGDILIFSLPFLYISRPSLWLNYAYEPD